MLSSGHGCTASHLGSAYHAVSHGGVSHDRKMQRLARRLLKRGIRHHIKATAVFCFYAAFLNHQNKDVFCTGKQRATWGDGPRVFSLLTAQQHILQATYWKQLTMNNPVQLARLAICHILPAEPFPWPSDKVVQQEAKWLSLQFSLGGTADMASWRMAFCSC